MSLVDKLALGALFLVSYACSFMLVANNVIPAPGLFALFEEPGKLKPRFLEVLTLAFLLSAFLRDRPVLNNTHNRSGAES